MAALLSEVLALNEKRAKKLRRLQKQVVIAAEKLRGNGMKPNEAAALALVNVTGVTQEEADTIVRKASEWRGR